MIPKIIHYCWLSQNPMPENLKLCIASWIKFLPDYEIKLWDFNRFPKGKSEWVDEAFAQKKYAFASDYIRCYALYNEGGIYLDSDVEVLKSFDPLLSKPYFLGLDSMNHIEAAVMGFEKGDDIFKNALDFYDSHSFSSFNNLDLITMPQILEKIITKGSSIKTVLSPNNLSNDNDYFSILPYTFFSPKSMKTGKIESNNDTFTIHHFEGSWYPIWKKYSKAVLLKIGGRKLINIIKRISFSNSISK